MMVFRAGAEWIELFDGKTPKGWKPRSEVISFDAKGGELHLLSKTNCLDIMLAIAS